MKRSKKALSIIVMLLMVATTLAPAWAFGTEAAPAALQHLLHPALLHRAAKQSSAAALPLPSGTIT